MGSDFNIRHTIGDADLMAELTYRRSTEPAPEGPLCCHRTSHGGCPKPIRPGSDHGCWFHHPEPPELEPETRGDVVLGPAVPKRYAVIEGLLRAGWSVADTAAAMGIQPKSVYQALLHGGTSIKAIRDELA